MFRFILALVVLVLVNSCKKTSADIVVAGEWIWTGNFPANPAYDVTPQNSGTQEILYFNPNGTYTVTRNGLLTDSGSYKISTGKSYLGDIPTVVYTNFRVKDSSSFYMLANNNDSLFFSNDLSGAVGSGSRHYGR